MGKQRTTFQKTHVIVETTKETGVIKVYNTLKALVSLKPWLDIGKIYYALGRKKQPFEDTFCKIERCPIIRE